MSLRKRRSSGMLSLLNPFLLAALLILFLTGRHIFATLHHDTIFEAIRRNDTDGVLAFLRAGTNPNQRENPPARSFADYMNQRFTSDTSWYHQRSPTPLLAALYTVEHSGPNSTNIQPNRHPNLTIIRALLEHGADVHATDETQMPAVSYAVRSGNVDVVDLMVRHGAKLNERQAWQPALLDAAGMGQTRMLRYLLDHDADVNITDGAAETALIYTVRYARQPDCVRLLLERHINVNAKDQTGKTALWYAQNPNVRLSARQTQHLPAIIQMLKQAGAK